MNGISELLHLAAAILWMGGMGFMIFALRPAAIVLEPSARLPFLSKALGYFFRVVWGAIVLLLLTGLHALASAGAGNSPAGWHAMAGIGVLMCLIFAHLYFAPFRRLKQAVAEANWPEGGRRMKQIALLAQVNFVLGWIAIAAVMLLK
jgi:uncharacterized membrane protein